MQMRIKKGKWYANFFHNDNFIGLSLKAYAPEKKKAHINLGKILEKLANGETIGSINKKLKDIVKKPEQVFIKKTGETDKQFVGLWTNHVCRLLGEYKVSDLTPEIMSQYMEDHWGLNEDEELQVMYSSFDKERQVLQKVIQLIKPHYSVQKELLSKIKYNETFKEQLPPLTPEQLYKATLKAKGHWGNIFLIMLYTGMEARDIYDLKPKNIKDEVIKKLRHKNKYRTAKTEIDMPIVSALQEVFNRVPTPVSKDQPYFKYDGTWDNQKNKVSKEIKKIFASAGLKGYGAKSLRRYVGEEINSQYMQEADKAVKLALAHSKNSQVTNRYTRPRVADLRTLMNGLADNIAEASDR